MASDRHPDRGAIAVLARAFAYGAVFVGVVLVFVPGRLLSWTGVSFPEKIRGEQWIGMLAVAVGCALAIWCVLAFALSGRGTPAPFDPPRRLVASGPYALVRNPMYIGAFLALAGAGLFCGSVALFAYAGTLLLAAHVFVVRYEEPRLQAQYGAGYDAYCRRVRRWWPRLRPSVGSSWGR